MDRYIFKVRMGLDERSATKRYVTHEAENGSDAWSKVHEELSGHYCKELTITLLGVDHGEYVIEQVIEHES